MLLKIKKELFDSRVHTSLKYSLMKLNDTIKPDNCVGRIDKTGYLLRSTFPDTNSLYIPTFEVLFQMFSDGLFIDSEDEQ